MNDTTSSGQSVPCHTTELTCQDCGRTFIFRKHQQEAFAQRGWAAPLRCHACRKRLRNAREEAQKASENAQWQKQREANQQAFERQLPSWNIVSLDNICPTPDSTLYILGNGFDLMHGVQSSFYSFRDSLGKRSLLRDNLEAFITLEDIWADFEEALAHFDMQFFSSRLNADTCLDLSGAYEEDAGAAEFFLAAESAAMVMTQIVDELPKRFYNWVSKLTVGTADRPLQNLFCSGRVLNFNYTEFVEALYNIPAGNICYIHGCRRRAKGAPKNKLILGHAPGASDAAFEEQDHSYADLRSRERREMIDAVQELVQIQLVDCDTELTKDCADIIAKHRDFFSSLQSVEKVITIGHSLSKVDWPYFGEIFSQLPDNGSTQFYFGCHGLRDLKNLESLLAQFGIDPRNVSVFRTDLIQVKKNTPISTSQRNNHVPAVRTLGTSADDRWTVQAVGNTMQIVESETGAVNYEAEFPARASSVCFAPDGQHLFVISFDYPSGIFLFAADNGNWHLIDELESAADYNFISSSLDRVFISEDKITFVYHNRVRVHSLVDGTLIYTHPAREARYKRYPGADITAAFKGNRN